MSLCIPRQKICVALEESVCGFTVSLRVEVDPGAVETPSEVVSVSAGEIFFSECDRDECSARVLSVLRTQLAAIQQATRESLHLLALEHLREQVKFFARRGASTSKDAP